MNPSSMAPRLIVIAFALLLASDRAVFGQDQPGSFSGIRLAGLPAVYVIDRSGREIRGTLVGLSDTSLTLLVGTTRQTFEPAQVSRVERKGDSLRNGAIIGAIVGALTAVNIGMADCPGGGHSCPGARIAFSLVGIATWAALGTAIDAAIPGRTLLWEAPSARSATASFEVSPGSRGAIASARIRW